MAWWLLYEELYGDMDKEYPIMNNRGIELSGGYEWTPGSPWPPIWDIPEQDSAYPYSDYYYDYNRNDSDIKNPFTDPKDRERAFKVTGDFVDGHGDVHAGAGNWEDKAKFIYESPDNGKTVYRYPIGTDPRKRERVILEGDVEKFPKQVWPTPLKDDCYPTVSSLKQEPSINKTAYKKYEEDKGIKDLQDYVTSTYNGHYTSQGSNVQTLDLIESVGDAESFCRSNAIKYLSRYDKKGQAKRDILKAMHYCLLLYYFSGNTQDNETPTRGYETF